MSGTSEFFSGVLWGLGNGIVISSIKRDLLGIFFTLARVESSGSSSEDPFSSASSSASCTSSSLSTKACEYTIGVQVLVMLFHVCVCSTPLSLWLSSIALAPAIIACVLPQKSCGCHFGLSHNGKLQSVSSISLTPSLTLVLTSWCWGLIAASWTVITKSGEVACSGRQISSSTSVWITWGVICSLPDSLRSRVECVWLSMLMWSGLIILWLAITSMVSKTRSGDLDLSGSSSCCHISFVCSFFVCAACCVSVILLNSFEIKASLAFKACTWLLVASRSCSLAAIRTIVCSIEMFFRISRCWARSCSSSPWGKMFRSEVGRKDDIAAWLFHVASDCCILVLNSCVWPAHNVCTGVISSSFK